MRRFALLAAHVVLVIAVVACRTVDSEAAPRAIVLSPGSTMSISVDTEGHVTITAVVPAGAPGEGTYVSTNPALLDGAWGAMDALNKPGGVTISVVGGGQLVGFGAIASR